MKHPGRPKSIGFQLANAEDAEKVSSFVAESESKKRDMDERNKVRSEEKKYIDIEIQEQGQLGITFANALDDIGLIVKVIDSQVHEVQLAKVRGDLKIGDLLCAVNRIPVLGDNGKGRNAALQLLQANGGTRPITLTFTRPYLHSILMESPVKQNAENTSPLFNETGPAKELIFARPEKSNKLYLKSFKNIAGKLESNGVLIGDHLVAINDLTVSVRDDNESGANDYEDRLERVHMMMHAASSYPLSFYFKRPKGHGKSNIGSTKLSITVDNLEEIGCTFGCLEQLSDCIAVESFHDVNGPIQKQILSSCQSSNALRVDVVDGQVAPSYVTPGMMTSVLQRRWEANGRVEVIFCDERQQHWVRTVAMG